MGIHAAQYFMPIIWLSYSLLRLSLYGLIQKVTSLSTVPLSCPFKARQYSNGSHITAACIPIYMVTGAQPY